MKIEFISTKWWKGNELEDFAALALLLADASIEEDKANEANEFIDKSEQNTKFKITIEKLD